MAYEPRARALDPAVASLAVQWERRTRNVSGALHVLVRAGGQLRPSAGLVAAELWGHRLVRFTVGPLSHLALLALAASQGALEHAGPGLPPGQAWPPAPAWWRAPGCGEPHEDAPARTARPGTCWRQRRRGRGR